MEYAFMYSVMAGFTVILAGMLIGLLIGVYIGIYKEKNNKKKRRSPYHREKRKHTGKNGKGKVCRVKKRKIKGKEEKGVLSKRMQTHESYVDFLCNEDKESASDYIRKARKTQEESYKARRRR